MAQKPEKKYCDFLEAVRKSGAVNMLGASHLIVEAFGVSEKEAKQILIDWIETYKGE